PRLHHVVLALRHLLDAAVNHRLAVRYRDRTDRGTPLIELLLDFRGVEPALLARLILAVIAMREQHPLRVQTLERLAELDEAHVTHGLCPEARVKQVQNSVLDATDV